MKKRPMPKKRDVSMKPPRPAAPPPPAVQPIPLELRPIASMPFGFNMCKVDPTLPPMASKTWEAPPEQLEEQDWVRAYLRSAECAVAGDIEKLGCTGVAAHEVGLNIASRSVAIGNAVTLGTRFRLGLAGSGVGLPCFVPPTRFCLIHNTIGGLEDGQAQHHSEFVEEISRKLTLEEEAKTKVMQHARKLKSVGDVNEFIAGKSPIDGDEPVVVEEGEQEEQPVQLAGLGTLCLSGEDRSNLAWKCTDHTSTVWTCRYCLAQAIVEGPLEPVTLVASHAKLDDAGKMVMPMESEFKLAGEAGVAARITEFEGDRIRGGSIMGDVWARVATFSRKLSRD